MQLLEGFACPETRRPRPVHAGQGPINCLLGGSGYSDTTDIVRQQRLVAIGIAGDRVALLGQLIWEGSRHD